VKFVAFVTLLIASHLLFIGQTIAQQYEGIVIDRETNMPLSYVNIGVVGKNVGTVSDSSGYFKILLDSKYDSDTLRFSMIGYAKRNFLVSDFKASQKSVQSKIELKPEPVQLNEITILSSRSLPKILGNKPKSKLVNVGFVHNNLGHEIGSIFRNKGNELVVDSVRLNFVKCNYDRVYLRLNVYKMEGDEIENVLQKPYYLSLTRNEILNSPTFDLADQHIVVRGDFLVSVELVKDLGERGLYFYAILKDDTSPGVYRETSQGNWINMEHKSQPVGISIQAFVH